MYRNATHRWDVETLIVREWHSATLITWYVSQCNTSLGRRNLNSRENGILLLWSRGMYRNATHRWDVETLIVREWHSATLVTWYVSQCNTSLGRRNLNSKRMAFCYSDHVVQNENYIYVIHNFTMGKYYCCVRLFHRNLDFIQTSSNLEESKTRYITDLDLC